MGVRNAPWRGMLVIAAHHEQVSRRQNCHRDARIRVSGSDVVRTRPALGLPQGGGPATRVELGRRRSRSPRLRPLEEVYKRSKPQECVCRPLNARFPLLACSYGTARSLQSRSLLSLHSYNAYLLGTGSPDRMGNGRFFPELGPSPPTMWILSALVPAELRNRVFVRCCTRPLPPGSLQVAEVVSN